jgi:uncharacterized membrane protein HdeD (DUF308 family)
MPTLMDFLDALHQGVWEVIVPKPCVTEPLDPPWTRSPFNVPTPGAVASYRNGQYHAHETDEDYRVHLDRYDPVKNPVMHLVDDAPLPLMIYQTMETLAVSARDARRGDATARLLDLRFSAAAQAGLGLLAIATGAILLLLGLGETRVLFQLIVPALVAISGVVVLAHGLVLHVRGARGAKAAVRGIALVAAGLLLYRFWLLYAVVMLVVLAVWFLSSAAVTLARVARTRGRLPQGFAFTLGLGLASLVIGAWAFVNPVRLVSVLVLLLGGVVMLGGLFFLVDGYGMWNAAGLVEARTGRAGG